MSSFTRRYSYDLDNRLTAFQHNEQLITYTFDSLGNILTVQCQQTLPIGSGDIGQKALEIKGLGNVEKEEVAMCPSCGTAIQPGKKFCMTCGSPVRAHAAELLVVPKAPSLPPHPGVIPEKPVPPPKCPGCGAVQEPGKKFCGKCGVAVIQASAPQAMFRSSTCLQCGSPVEPGKKFCGKCGAKMF